MLNDNPVFYLSLDFANASGFVLVNRQIVFESSETIIQTEIPVNEWINNTHNEFSFVLFPNDEAKWSYPPQLNAMATLVVQIGMERFKLTSLITNGLALNSNQALIQMEGETTLNSNKQFQVDLSSGDIRISKATHDRNENQHLDILSRTVNFPPLPIGKWGFHEGDELVSGEGINLASQLDDSTLARLTDEIFHVYQWIWNQIDNSRFNELTSRFAERSQEFDIAYYRDKSHTEKILISALHSSKNDPGKKLWPISRDNAVLEISDNRKLVRLVQNNWKPLIAFEWREGGAEYYDIYLYRKNGKWIISR